MLCNTLAGSIVCNVRLLFYCSTHVQECIVCVHCSVVTSILPWLKCEHCSVHERILQVASGVLKYGGIKLRLQ